MIALPRNRSLLALVALVAVLGAVAAGVILTREDDASPLDSFYFEASIETAQTLDATAPSRVRAWYQGPNKTRWELGPAESDAAEDNAVILSDGAELIYYDPQTNTYQKQPVPEGFEDGPLPLFSSLLVGPLPLGRSLSEFFAEVQDTIEARVVGKETLLGREVTVVEVVPVQGSPASAQDSKQTLWVDERYNFVLRQVVEAGDEGASLRAEVTALEYNGVVDNERFTFAPPASAQEIEPPSSSGSGSSSSGPLGSRDVVVPEGFLRPTHVPEGYVTTGNSSTVQGNNMTTAVDIQLEPEGADQSAPGPFVSIQEQFRAGGGLPQSFRSGSAVSIRGREGYQSSEGDLRRIVFSEGNVIVVITSNAFDFPELVRIAESMV